MSKRPLVHCRICKKEINRDSSIEGVDWIQASPGWYYHPQCYEDFGKKKQKIHDDIHADVGNELWFSALYDYLRKDLKMELDMRKVTSQWNNFLKKGFTAKGIYFCMRYFYGVQHGDPTKSDGIGIVSYIYKDGCQYWVEREMQEQGICEKIEAQIRKQENRQSITIIKKEDNTKKIIDLSTIRDMEEYD